MTSLDVADLVPHDKRDLKRARKAVRLGYPGIAPIVPLLLEWLQDVNWPVAEILQPMLADIGLPIAEDILPIITGEDYVWTQYVLEHVVYYSGDLITALRPEIEAIAAHTGDDPEANDAAEAARELLRLQGI